MRAKAFLAALIFTTATVACGTATGPDGAGQEADIVGDRDAGTTTSAPAKGKFPGGYVCDPLKNEGCPTGEACLLAFDKNEGNEVVKCKRTDSPKFCGFSFDWSESHVEIDGRFVGMVCLGGEASGVPMAACIPLNSDGIPSVNCPLPSQTCKFHEGDGIYGFCERFL
jgi:hypothetical protein